MKEMKWRSLQPPADADELLSHSSQSATRLHLVHQVFVIKHTQGAPLIKAAVAGARALLVPKQCFVGRWRADTARCRRALHGQTAQLWTVSSLTAPWALRHAPWLSSRVGGALILMTAHGSTGLVPLTPTVRAQPRAASVRATITSESSRDRQTEEELPEAHHHHYHHQHHHHHHHQRRAPSLTEATLQITFPGSVCRRPAVC